MANPAGSGFRYGSSMYTIEVNYRLQGIGPVVTIRRLNGCAKSDGPGRLITIT